MFKGIQALIQALGGSGSFALKALLAALIGDVIVEGPGKAVAHLDPRMYGTQYRGQVAETQKTNSLFGPNGLAGPGAAAAETSQPGEDSHEFKGIWDTISDWWHGKSSQKTKPPANQAGAQQSARPLPPEAGLPDEVKKRLVELGISQQIINRIPTRPFNTQDGQMTPQAAEQFITAQTQQWADAGIITPTMRAKVQELGPPVLLEQSKMFGEQAKAVQEGAKAGALSSQTALEGRVRNGTATMADLTARQELRAATAKATQTENVTKFQQQFLPGGSGGTVQDMRRGISDLVHL